MANTVNSSVNATWQDASGNSIAVAGSKSTTQAGSTAAQIIQIIGTVTEALVFPADSAPPGVLVLKNLDPTNFIEFDLNTPVAGGTTAFIKLRAGETDKIHTSRTTIYAKADTAACNLQITIIPD